MEIGTKDTRIVNVGWRDSRGERITRARNSRTKLSSATLFTTALSLALNASNYSRATCEYIKTYLEREKG